MRNLPQNTQQVQNITSREKKIRLNDWLSKLSLAELAEYKAGMSDQRRYTLRLKYPYYPINHLITPIIMNTPNNTMPSNETLSELGEVIATAYEGTCYLYSYLGTNYVVLSENSVMTQEEDNNNGPEEAIFPYSL